MDATGKLITFEGPCKTCARWVDNQRCGLCPKKRAKKQIAIDVILWGGDKWPTTTAEFRCYLWHRRNGNGVEIPAYVEARPTVRRIRKKRKISVDEP